MSIYMISFDLSHSEYNYERVLEKIKSCKNWCHYLDATTYVVKTEDSQNEIQKSISKHLTETDRLIVCKIDNPVKWMENKRLKWEKQ